MLDAEGRDNEGVVDLHTHTTASDGTLTLSERVESAADQGIEHVAITDHDIIHEGLERPVEIRAGVEVITGVEIRADLFETKVELLGYFINPSHSGLRDLLVQAREFRRERNRALVDALGTETCLELSYEFLAASVEGNLGRPHLASLLVEEGIVDSIGAAFEEYLAESGRAFVPMERHPATTVLSTIHAAGGVASLAHPGRIRTDSETVERMVAELARQGLDGLEVWYPYGKGSREGYADVDVEDARALAGEFGLVPTGGSDCHGPGSGKDRMGEVTAPRSSLQQLKDRATPIE